MSLFNIAHLVCLFIVFLYYVVVYCVVLLKVHGTLLKVPTAIAAMLEQHQAPTLELCESFGKSVADL